MRIASKYAGIVIMLSCSNTCSAISQAVLHSELWTRKCVLEWSLDSSMAPPRSDMKSAINYTARVHCFDLFNVRPGAQKISANVVVYLMQDFRVLI
jgi:hypothetical protein